MKHTTTVDEGEPWVEFYVCFGRKLYETLVAIDAISDDPIIPTVLTEDTFKRCEDLLFRFKRGGIMNRKTLLLDLQKFVMRMNTLSQEMESTDSNEVIISELCLVLGERLNVKIDIKALCQQYPLGYESIRKIFKARVGTSLHHYRVMKRINEAKRLLHNKSISLKRIADDLGYKDQYAFSNQFKKYVGVAPKSFRQQL